MYTHTCRADKRPAHSGYYVDVSKESHCAAYLIVRCRRFFIPSHAISAKQSQTPLHGHRLRTCCTTPPTDKLTTILYTTCCTTNLPHRNARAQHLDMSRCWDVAIFCPLIVNLLYNKLQNCCELVRWWCCTTCP